MYLRGGLPGTSFCPYALRNRAEHSRALLVKVRIPDDDRQLRARPEAVEKTIEAVGLKLAVAAQNAQQAFCKGAPHRTP